MKKTSGVYTTPIGIEKSYNPKSVIKSADSKSFNNEKWLLKGDDAIEKSLESFKKLRNKNK